MKLEISELNALETLFSNSNLSRADHHKNKTLLPYLNAKKNGTFIYYLTLPKLYVIESICS